MKKLKPVPAVGTEYHFWDDGKTSPGRHYICRCERVINPEEAKSIIVEALGYDENGDACFSLIKLFDQWSKEAALCDWVFSPETDFFVECSCPSFDQNNLWFVRTLDGGWFSMDIQNSWQGGRLDVDGTIFETTIKTIKDHPELYTNPERCIKVFENEKYGSKK